jgi:hypothetical protein
MMVSNFTQYEIAPRLKNVTRLFAPTGMAMQLSSRRPKTLSQPAATLRCRSEKTREAKKSSPIP